MPDTYSWLSLTLPKHRARFLPSIATELELIRVAQPRITAPDLDVRVGALRDRTLSTKLKV